tara:strand:- start:483 stop:1178 length:696 start_codon:yes stop_codon:yes gene_type:complete
MNKLLITNGCSFTYGDELSRRNHEAFPYLLALKHNIPVNNLAYNGKSNEAIVRTTLEFMLDSDLSKIDPIFIIGWSGIARKEFYSDGKWSKITPTQVAVNKLAEVHYMYLQSNKQDNLEFFNHTLLLQLLFESKNYQYFFFNIDDGQVLQNIKNGGSIKGSNKFSDNYNLNHINNSYINEINLNNFPSFVDKEVTFLNYSITNGGGKEKGGHPNAKSHQIWADYLSTKLKF